jgi:microsomal dipeptidase-like Zn-dependent dipeptidase
LPFHENGISSALAPCTPLHGPQGISLNPEIGHNTQGYPKFDGWPRFTTLVHQQAYVDWIKRAFDGGLRLVCCLAVNNELLAERSGVTDVNERNDRTSIERQVEAMKEMIHFIDQQSGGEGQGWMQIALSPQQARSIIQAGKLAVVLAVEVSSLGNWRTPDDLPRDLNQARTMIRNELQWLYNMGVRQITPIHVADNAFGGCAIYNRIFDAVNRFVAGRGYEVRNGWETGVRYRIDQDEGGGLIPLGVSYGGVLPPTPGGPGSHVNARGLTCYGRILLEEMMRLGMIIDIDHFSELSTDEALAILEAYTYPVISSHSGFRELALTADVPFTDRALRRAYGTDNVHKIPHESLKRPDQVERIRKLGGMVAPIMIKGDYRDVGTVAPAQAGKVANDCAGSSKSWAQSYLYAVDKMKGQGVALGSDVGGLAGLPGPRFGPYAAHGCSEDHFRERDRRAEAAAQKNGVRYSTPIVDYRFYRFEPAIAVLADHEIYTQEERDIWEAIAIYRSGTDPDTAEQPPWPLRTSQEKIKNLARGFYCTHESRLLQPGPTTGNAPWEQRAAFLVRHGLAPQQADTAEVHRLHPIIRRIWNKWQDMEGNNQPLTRSLAGQRDFDVNIDGMAHYGLLPDLIQDLRNVGLTDQDLAPLFRSAEDYIRMWTTCTQL